MPWHIEKNASGEYCVIKDSDGKSAGCHKTEAEAKAQLAALYASEGNKMADSDGLLFATEARVTVRATSAALLELAHSRAPDKTVFEQFPPFFFESEISSDRLDSFFTIMDPLTTLPNYARDAAAGVAVLVGHDTRTLPIGQSLSGTLETIGDVTRVRSDAYI